jgi:hypothetical protein
MFGSSTRLHRFNLLFTPFNEGNFHIALGERLGEILGDYMDTWKMTHFNEFFFVNLFT